MIDFFILLIKFILLNASPNGKQKIWGTERFIDEVLVSEMEMAKEPYTNIIEDGSRITVLSWKTKTTRYFWFVVVGLIYFQDKDLQLLNQAIENQDHEAVMVSRRV